MMTFPIYGKIKNVPNHQPDEDWWNKTHGKHPVSLPSSPSRLNKWSSGKVVRRSWLGDGSWVIGQSWGYPLRWSKIEMEIHGGTHHFPCKKSALNDGMFHISVNLLEYVNPHLLPNCGICRANMSTHTHDQPFSPPKGGVSLHRLPGAKDKKGCQNCVKMC